MNGYRCPMCRSTRVVFDFNGDEPVEIGCVQCKWAEIAGTRDDGLPEVCVGLARTSGNGRCGRWAVLNGLCWQHADKGYFWDRLYVWLRNGADDLTDNLPEAYREAFVRGLIDADVIKQDERKSRRVAELRERATKLREAKGRIDETSVVYFMRREGLIKIGTTTKLGQRVQAISKGGQMPPGMSVGPVEVLATTPGDRALERRLHQQFRDDRVGNTEWFRSTPQLLRLVARYQRRADPAASAAA